jgi:hypothetical protein
MRCTRASALNRRKTLLEIIQPYRGVRQDARKNDRDHDGENDRTAHTHNYQMRASRIGP